MYICSLAVRNCIAYYCGGTVDHIYLETNVMGLRGRVPYESFQLMRFREGTVAVVRTCSSYQCYTWEFTHSAN